MMFGNEIKTLVNEEKPIGSYEVEFNATELPSGIYFYRIQAGLLLKLRRWSSFVRLAALAGLRRINVDEVKLNKRINLPPLLYLK